MQQEKKKILDEVTETETYKKAKEILLKFAPDQLRMTPVSSEAHKHSLILKYHSFSVYLFILQVLC